MSERIARKVLLIGWDAAEWGVINPLLDAGRMPALQQIVENGVVGNIATLHPPLSPMLWTSIATGKTADTHGILGFTEPDPRTGGIRPVTGTSRRVKAVWNILHHEKFRCNVVNWWPSHPAEPVNGAMVSNFFNTIGNMEDTNLINIPGTIHPPELEETLTELQVHPVELTSALLQPFVPRITELDPKEHIQPVSGIAKYLAKASGMHAAATWLMRNTEWDFMALYLDTIDHISHGFMKYRPPRLEGIPESQYEIYKEVVDGMYVFHDMMLQRLVQLAGPDTTIILLSDHGFYANHLRMLALPKFATAPAIEHNPYGVLCMSGPGIRKDERVYGATLLDITPTLLTLFGLPVGRDMNGKVLTSIFDKEVTPEFINSWEDLEGDFGTYSGEQMQDTIAEAAVLKQLIDLGYVEDPGDDQNLTREKCIAEHDFNLALVYMRKRRYPEALAMLEEVHSRFPENLPYMISLAECYMALERFGDFSRIIGLLKNREDYYPPNIDLMEGIVAGRQGDYQLAMACFRSVKEGELRSPSLLLELGRVLLKTQQYAEALDSFGRAVNMDPDSSQGYLGMGIASLRLGNYEDAVDHLLTSIGLIYHFAPAHYHLGESLFHMKKFEDAARAFEVCLTMSPGQRKAHQWLARIYTAYLPDRQKADFHLNYLKENMNGEITIVSGLPRSGTSLMMQMLQAGGIDLLTDGLRQPDENNPRGYLEYEPVKNLARDNSFLHLAQDKAVKVISQLLPFLPLDFSYKIIFMLRDIDEVLQSQQVMLGKPKHVYPVEIANMFRKEIEKVKKWADSQPNVDILFVDFAELFNNPDKQVITIGNFLEKPVDKSAMVKEIDPSLYRNKKIL